jgi:hypothetical protein
VLRGEDTKGLAAGVVGAARAGELDRPLAELAQAESDNEGVDVMRFKAFAVLAAIVAMALVMALPVSAAGNAGSTQVSTFDATGAVFTCPGVNYTVLGGSVLSVFHDSIAGNGSEHVTGTTAPTGVTLTDGVTNTTYRLAGASWFGGNLNYVNGKYEFADTEFFNILGPSGGVVVRVAGVEHSGSGGSNFSFTFGQCEAPQN